MKVAKPTKKQVFDELRNGCGCCWVGGKGCQCYSRQLKQCYDETEKSLTKTEKTPEEIKQDIAHNQKVTQGYFDLLNELYE